MTTTTTGVTQYDELVTVRVWDSQREQFRNPQSDVDAYRKQVHGVLRLYLGGRNSIVATGKPTKESEITDAEGRVYIVRKVEGAQPYVCHVEPKTLTRKKSLNRPKKGVVSRVVK